MSQTGLAATPKAGLAGKRILVVDDNLINLDIAGEALLSSGAEVDSAAGGEEALTFLAKTTYDLVLLDLTMPGIDGLAVGRAIRASENNSKTPVLLFTASDTGDAKRAPATIHADIAATLGLDLDAPKEVRDGTPDAADYATTQRRKRDPGFRERVLRAYEYRCCICGFDLRIGHTPAGLEAAHIQWHHIGGPDIEPNGLSLCALHHKLFDLGVFTVDPSEYRVIFSQHAISGDRSLLGDLRFHGRPIHAPQHTDLLPAPEFLAWNTRNVFKTPARRLVLTGVVGPPGAGR